MRKSRPGDIERKACPRCGGDLKAWPAEYGVEWVCMNWCGTRLTEEQLAKVKQEKSERLARESAARVEIEEAVKVDDKIDENIDTIPPKPDTTGMSVSGRNKALRQYYLENKEAIIDDYHNIGEPAMLRKWGISWTGWHSGFGHNWLPKEVGKFKQKSRSKAHKKPPAPKKTPSDRSRLPELPPWQESWGDSVKVEWLRTLQALESQKGK